MSYSKSENHIINELPPPPPGKTGWPWTVETNPEIYSELKCIPKITIVTPTLNQGEFIEETIRSVLLQNYPDTEYIVIDGGSTDKSSEILDKYDKWIKYRVSEKDKGQSEAINKGLKKSTGEIFNWINSDDYYYPDCFKIIADCFSSEKVFAVAGSYRFYSDTGKIKEKFIKSYLRSSVEETMADVPVNQSSTFFRSEIIKSLGGLDEKLEFVMDQEFWIKYLFRYGQDNIKVTDKTLTNFRFHEKSKTHNNSFVTEYNRIYNSIALKSGLGKHSEIIKLIYNNIDTKKFVFNYNLSEKEILLAKRMMNYYMLLRSKKSLTENNIPLFLKILPQTHPEYLNNDNRAVYQNLKIKYWFYKNNLSFLLKLISKRNY